MSEDMAKIIDQLKIMAPAQKQTLAELKRVADAQERTAAAMEKLANLMDAVDGTGFFTRHLRVGG